MTGGIRSRAGSACRLAAAALAVVVLAGCGGGGFTIYSIPLPGGANLGSHPYQITAQFTNVADLVPQSAVEVNDVAVGRVARIYLRPNGWIANVTMIINGKVRLPANAIAQVEQSSLLGEQYIALAPPPGLPATGRLSNGAVIPVSRTTTNATVEQVLGALSLLLNDGGVSQLHTIVSQLDIALKGNEPQIRSLVIRMNTLLANLNSHRQDIKRALAGLDSLSVTLAARDRQIGHVLDRLTPGMQVLAEQRAQLVTMLKSITALTSVTVNTIHASQASMVEDLRLLEPTLAQLAAAGRALPLALQVLLTYPFTDQVLSGIKGDYLNAYLSLRAAKGTSIIPAVRPAHHAGRH